MKKVMKRVITACLAFAMILALVTPASVEAATKNESLTLYKGETYTWYLTGVKSLSSASSTKKAVATVKANKSKKQYTISAKKAGTSVVTIKGKDYYGHTQSLKIKVTVAEPKFDLKLQKLDGNYRLYDDAALERLWEILVYRAMGLDLKEIKDLLTLSEKQKNQYLEKKIRGLRQQIRQLNGQMEFISYVQQNGMLPVPTEENTVEKTYMDHIAVLRKMKQDQKREDKEK